jgi:hypothetical protein
MESGLSHCFTRLIAESVHQFFQATTTPGRWWYTVANMSFESYTPQSHPGNPEFNKFVLYNSDLKVTFDQLDAAHWIDTFRAEDELGAVDIAKTADNVGVSVEYEIPLDENGQKQFANGLIRGLDGDEPISIHLDLDWRTYEIRQTFGHELGHLFLKKVAGIYSAPGGRDRTVEAFCDYFGLQMALPVDKIQNINDVNADVIADITNRYNVGHFAVMHQFMESGALPKRMLFDTSMGDVPNPLYSDKIDQRIICYDCHINKQHEPVTLPLRIDALDLTQYDWSLTTPYIGCRAGSLLDLRRHRLLNISYNRWSDEDEWLMEQELKKKSVDSLPLDDPFGHQETSFWS